MSDKPHELTINSAILTIRPSQVDDLASEFFGGVLFDATCGPEDAHGGELALTFPSAIEAQAFLSALNSFKVRDL
jgi:hypothetical protein